MKFRLGICAFLFVLAGCSEDPNAALSPPKSLAKGMAILPSAPATSLRDPASSIANAPDNGALVKYAKGSPIAKQGGAYTLYPVAISEAHALKAVVTGLMTVPMPDGSQVKLKYERHAEDADGNWTWVGRLVDGDQRQEAIITFGEKAVFGSIPQQGGNSPLRLFTQNGGVVAVQTDSSKVPNIHSGGTDVMVRPQSAATSALAKSVQQGVAHSAIAQSAVASAANTVDIAIGYTPGFAATYGGQSQAVTRLAYLLQVSNQSYSNSLITGALRIVTAIQVDYADNNTNEIALGQLTGNNGTAAVAIPAGLLPLRTARDEKGADLAVLVRKFQTPENDGCGIAWLNGAGQTAINPAVDDDFGFAVVGDGFDTGTDNKSYFCPDETLVHELAHLMGSAHDRDNSKDSSGNLQYGRYPYSFGMKTTATTGNFYTIMAYGDNNQNFYRTFSNPLVLKCGPSNNLSCGLADQTDNARSLNQTIPVVATFRSTVVPLVGKSRGDFNGDTRSDILWRNESAAQVSYWLMNGATRLASGVTGVIATSHVVGLGDFDGDGYSDVLWQSDSNNFVWLWRSKGDGTFEYKPIDFYPAGWTVAGVTDINGDSKTDIVWRNATAGLVSYWIMNGAVRTSESTTSVDPTYRVVGTGDFDGDGFGDVLWTNAGNSFLWLHRGRATPGFDYQFVDFYPAGWAVTGVADFNGDGKSDIAWQNTQQGLFSYWLMNGGTRIGSGAITIPAGNEIVGTGDFDGDGISEALWKNTPGNFLWIHRSVGNGTFEYKFVDFLPANWTVVNGGY